MSSFACSVEQSCKDNCVWRGVQHSQIIVPCASRQCHACLGSSCEHLTTFVSGKMRAVVVPES